MPVFLMNKVGRLTRVLRSVCDNAIGKSVDLMGVAGRVAHALMDIHAIPLGIVFRAHQTAQASSAGMTDAERLVVHALMGKHAMPMGSACACQNAKASSADLTDVVEHVGLAQELMSATSKQVSANHASQTAMASNVGQMDAEGLVAHALMDKHAMPMGSVSAHQTAMARNVEMMDAVEHAGPALLTSLSAQRRVNALCSAAPFPTHGDLLVCIRGSKPLLTKLMSRQTAQISAVTAKAIVL